MNKFKYCPHRGFLADSLTGVKEFSSKEDFLKFLNDQPLVVVTENSLSCTLYEKDKRTDWKEVWLIKDSVGVIGFTDSDINLFCQKSLEHKGKRVRESFLLAKFPNFKAKTKEGTSKRIKFLKELVEETKVFIQSHDVRECILEMDKLLTDGEKDKFFYTGLLFFQKLKQTHKLNSGEINSPDFNPANYV